MPSSGKLRLYNCVGCAPASAGTWLQLVAVSGTVGAGGSVGVDLAGEPLCAEPQPSSSSEMDSSNRAHIWREECCARIAKHHPSLSATAAAALKKLLLCNITWYWLQMSRPGEACAARSTRAKDDLASGW